MTSRRSLLACLSFVSLVALLGAGCRSPSSNTGDRNAAFWSWFTSHSAEIATIERGDEPIADALHEELKKVRSELTFELGPRMVPRELIVSADGLREAFPAVASLVAAAPAMSGWKAIAFRQRKPGFVLEYDGVKLSADDVRMTTSPEPSGKTAVELYVAGLTPANKKKMEGACLLLLDATLGEYDVETRLGVIDIDAPPPSGAHGMKPLSELPAIIDAMKKR